MSLSETPNSMRKHIGFFGACNAGKSSLINAFTGQDLAIVSAQAGTTTDPVKKAMELLPFGPVVVIDTPGFDDEGELGALRTSRTNRVLEQVDVAILVEPAGQQIQAITQRWLERVKQRGLPHIVARSKADLAEMRPPLSDGEMYVSAQTGENIAALKNRVAALLGTTAAPRPLVSDLFAPGDTVLLVTPLDESAPQGRLILPQQQVLREIIASHGRALVCQPQEVAGCLALMKAPPRLVITDSQAFAAVASAVPAAIPLTSFSILFARFKGNLGQLTAGVARLRQLRNGEEVLIAEGCTHHRQCNDIGTVKLPRWIEAHCGAKPHFSFASGGGFPEDLTPFALIVHCGGCMLNAPELQRRQSLAQRDGVPMVNYGLAIAAMHGILERALAPLEGRDL